jgi:tRNA(Ile)-lysidine synthase
MDLVNKVRKTIIKENLIEAGEKVLVGLSGGIDSTAMLHVLAELAGAYHFKIGIAHINHLLRGEESERDQHFVETLALRFSFPCHVKRFDVRAYAAGRGISLQHAGRDVRYRFFDEVVHEQAYSRIAIAHNLDDQIETFMLRMLKGSGIKGLASIPIKRDKIIRPFLNIYRSEIEEYVNVSSILYVEDSSNKGIKYERNYVRKEIIPAMKKLNPVFKEKISFLLQDISRINVFFEEQSARFMGSHLNSKEQDVLSFGIKELEELDSETRFRTIANVLDMIEPGFIILREHYMLVEKILRGKRPNLAVVLPRGIRAVRTYGRLTFTKKQINPVIKDVLPVMYGKNILKPFNIVLEISKITNRPLIKTFCSMEFEALKEDGKNIAFLDADKAGNMCVRTFQEGDRFKPLGMNNYVKLKDFFISRKIPKEQRRHIPLLTSNKDIMWVVGHRIDERYKVTEQSKNVMQVAAKPY